MPKMVNSIGPRKFSDRLIIIFGVAIILIISLLFAHVCMYMKLSKEVLVIPSYYAKQQHSNRIGLVLDKDGLDIEDESADRIFNFVETQKRDGFDDLKILINELELNFQTEQSSVTSDSKPKVTLGEKLGMEQSNNYSSWEQFCMGITGDEMYPENSPTVENLLRDLATLRIHRVEENLRGTQFKLNIHYRNNMMAMFKPMRCARDVINPPNQIYYAEFERHNAEIAAFHVDRLLGFRRAIPTAGRTVNVITQLKRIGDSEFQKTFYTSAPPDGNVCFTGNCEQFCDDYNPICGDGVKLEGSFMAYLPDDELTKRRTHDHPWQRSYHPLKKSQWEDNPNFCEKVKAKYPINESRHLLDFVDTSILDFLIGNRDRHGFQIFRTFGNNSFHMHYDHGRSFGRPYYDDLTILAPLIQCCSIRASTLKTLLNFHNGPKPMSVALSESMSNDLLAPVLWEPHLTALDRRIEKILHEIRHCVQQKPSVDVIIIN